jgi:hypothetical protein
VVLLHPVVKTAILNKPGDLMVRGLSRLFPHSDLLIRTGGTMEIARHSYMRIGEDSMYEQDTSVE